MNIYPTIAILVLDKLEVYTLILLLCSEPSYVLKALKRVVMMNFFVEQESIVALET